MTPLEATAAVGDSPHRRYFFGDFEVDLDRGSLARLGDEIPLRPKPFAMLLHLLEHAGRAGSKKRSGSYAGTFAGTR